jgi:lysozyme family protein
MLCATIALQPQVAEVLDIEAQLRHSLGDIMADLKISISKTLVHEGGYVDNPNDPGGATKYGVTQRDIDGVRSAFPDFPADVKDLTMDQATRYYLHTYVKPHVSEIQDQALTDKLFDMGVLFGIGTAVNILERVLNLPVDGIFGTNDLVATNEAEPSSLLSAFKTGLVSHAIGVANARPSERIFLHGWIVRVNS